VRTITVVTQVVMEVAETKTTGDKIAAASQSTSSTVSVAYFRAACSKTLLISTFLSVPQFTTALRCR
jgi:hypothetical protein